jgi:glycosyltransferase involved in cell wall biosynthesis
MKGSGERAEALVSLGLPVYNGAEFITETISSLLAQDYPQFELIITDNASNDTTEAICRAFAAADPRIRYIRNEENLGAGPNHNLGFHLSGGLYFKWCAADDMVSPNFVSACVRALELNPDAVLAYGTTRSIDQRGRTIPLIGREMTKHDPNDSAVLRFHKDLLDRVTCTNFQAFGLIRSNILRKTFLHRSYYGSDQTLISELALLGRFINVPEAIFYNREHPGRSINLREKRRTHQWQDSKARGMPLPANVYRLQHLVLILFRHRQVASLRQTIPVLTSWTAEKTMDRVRLWYHQFKNRARGKLSS